MCECCTKRKWSPKGKWNDFCSKRLALFPFIRIAWLPFSSICSLPACIRLFPRQSHRYTINAAHISSFRYLYTHSTFIHAIWMPRIRAEKSSLRRMIELNARKMDLLREWNEFRQQHTVFVAHIARPNMWEYIHYSVGFLAVLKHQFIHHRFCYNHSFLFSRFLCVCVCSYVRSFCEVCVRCGWCCIWIDQLLLLPKHASFIYNI